MFFNYIIYFLGIFPTIYDIFPGPLKRFKLFVNWINFVWLVGFFSSVNLDTTVNENKNPQTASCCSANKLTSASSVVVWFPSFSFIFPHFPHFVGLFFPFALFYAAKNFEVLMNCNEWEREREGRRSVE